MFLNNKLLKIDIVFLFQVHNFTHNWFLNGVEKIQLSKFHKNHIFLHKTC
jgi:hypothetical protein